MWKSNVFPTCCPTFLLAFPTSFWSRKGGYPTQWINPVSFNPSLPSPSAWKAAREFRLHLATWQQFRYPYWMVNTYITLTYNPSISGWRFQPTPLKNDGFRQLGLFFPIYIYNGLIRVLFSAPPVFWPFLVFLLIVHLVPSLRVLEPHCPSWSLVHPVLHILFCKERPQSSSHLYMNLVEFVVRVKMCYLSEVISLAAFNKWYPRSSSPKKSTSRDLRCSEAVSSSSGVPMGPVMSSRWPRWGCWWFMFPGSCPNSHSWWAGSLRPGSLERLLKLCEQFLFSHEQLRDVLSRLSRMLLHRSSLEKLSGTGRRWSGEAKISKPPGVCPIHWWHPTPKGQDAAPLIWRLLEGVAKLWMPPVSVRSLWDWACTICTLYATQWCLTAWPVALHRGSNQANFNNFLHSETSQQPLGPPTHRPTVEKTHVRDWSSNHIFSLLGQDIGTRPKHGQHSGDPQVTSRLLWPAMTSLVCSINLGAIPQQW